VSPRPFRTVVALGLRAFQGRDGGILMTPVALSFRK
jgi:hypothetical protein